MFKDYIVLALPDDLPGEFSGLREKTGSAIYGRDEQSEIINDIMERLRKDPDFTELSGVLDLNRIEAQSKRFLQEEVEQVKETGKPSIIEYGAGFIVILGKSHYKLAQVSASQGDQAMLAKCIEKEVSRFFDEN